MDIIKVFGSNVKAYRQRIGLSQEAFAEKCGMHRTYISAIECFLQKHIIRKYTKNRRCS